jgi:hypothetical protein
MIARFANLVVASCFAVVAIASVIGRDWRWAGSPSPPHSSLGPLTVQGTVMIAVCGLWFLAAFMMFFHSRLAWVLSLIGVFQAVIFFLSVLTDMAGELLFHRAQMLREMATVGTVPMILSAVMMVGFMTVCLAVCVTLLATLFKMRREFHWI